MGPAVEVRESQKYAKATFKNQIVSEHLQKHPGNTVENVVILSMWNSGSVGNVENLHLRRRAMLISAKYGG